MAHRGATRRSGPGRGRAGHLAGAALDAPRVADPSAARSPSHVAEGTAETEPQALVATHWFDSGSNGEPYAATVRFTGHRAGVRGRPGPRDTFVQDETIARVVPGSGPVSISTWIYGLEPGEWSVAAELVSGMTATGPSRRMRRDGASSPALQPTTWSWRRWALAPNPSPLFRTRWALTAPLARIPAVLPGSLPVLVVVGALVALITQTAILAHEEEPVGPSLLVSLMAIVAGLVAAKLWYAVLHPGEPVWKPGWAVDGFLIVAPLAALGGLFLSNLPIGVYLDASTPGLFAAVALGRVGCFFTGCCAGRCTNARWGVWSSDRRVGARRIPTQLLESATGLVLAVVTLPLVLLHPPLHGLVFVGAFAIYALVRQVLLRLRAEQRASRRSLPLTAAAAATILLAVSATLVAFPRHPPSMVPPGAQIVEDGTSR